MLCSFRVCHLCGGWQLRVFRSTQQEGTVQQPQINNVCVLVMEKTTKSTNMSNTELGAHPDQTFYVNLVLRVLLGITK